MLDKPVGFCSGFQLSNFFIQYVLCIHGSNRIFEIDKIVQQKGEAKKNSALQKILTNLSDELEVLKINNLILK